MPGGFLPSAQAQVCPRRDCGAEPPRGSRSGSGPRRPACRKDLQSRKARVISGLCSPRKRAFGLPPRKRGPSRGRIERGGFAPGRSVAPARRGSSRDSHCQSRRDGASGTVSAPLLVPYRDTGDTGARSRQSAGTKVDRPGPIPGPGGRMPSRPDETTPEPCCRGLREGLSYQDLSHRSCDRAASHRCDRTDRAMLLRRAFAARLSGRDRREASSAGEVRIPVGCAAAPLPWRRMA